CPSQSISSISSPGMTAVAPTPPAEASAAVVDDSAAAMSSSSALVPTATIVSPSTRIASGGGVPGSQNSGVSESAGGAKVRTTALENRRMTTSLEWPITGAVDPSAPGAAGGRSALAPSGFYRE